MSHIDPDDEVSSDQPDSPITTHGTDHITVTGSNPEDTIGFYRDILGMPLVMSQPNLDRRHLDHLFFDTGDGRLLTYFVEKGRDSDPEAIQPDVGGVHHLAFQIETSEIDEIKQLLESHGYDVSKFDRGAFLSLYTTDPNGLTIELAADKYEIPDEKRGGVLARAHAERMADGAEYVQEDHMETALVDLGIADGEADVERLRMD